MTQVNWLQVKRAAAVTAAAVCYGEAWFACVDVCSLLLGMDFCDGGAAPSTRVSSLFMVKTVDARCSSSGGSSRVRGLLER